MSKINSLYKNSCESDGLPRRHAPSVSTNRLSAARDCERCLVGYHPVFRCIGDLGGVGTVNPVLRVKVLNRGYGVRVRLAPEGFVSI